MRNARRCLMMMTMPLFLTACILTSDPVVAPEEAQDVPGLAGHWRATNGSEDVYIRAEPRGDYSMSETTREFKYLWRARRLDRTRYVAEMPLSDLDANVAVLFEILPGYGFVHHDIAPSLIKEVAQKTGLRVSGEPPTILSQQPRKLIDATLKALMIGRDPESALLYIRQGAFVEPGGEANSSKAMQQLLQQGQTEAAITMGRYLSDRGDVPAQLILMSLASAGLLDRSEGIRHGLRAVQSERTGREAELGQLYATPGEPGATISEADATEALFWLATAQLDSATPANQERIREMTKVICYKRDLAAIKGCLETVPTYWKVQAVTARQVQDAVTKWVRVQTLLEAKQARQQEIDQEIQAEERRRQELEAEYRALEIQVCGRPGCYRKK